MEWWTHLWCNEGTTRFFEFNAMHHLFPEWNMWDQFVSAIFNDALRLDALTSTHAVEIDVNHPSEIRYAKEGSLPQPDVSKLTACGFWRTVKFSI